MPQRRVVVLMCFWVQVAGLGWLMRPEGLTALLKQNRSYCEAAAASCIRFTNSVSLFNQAVFFFQRRSHICFFKNWSMTWLSPEHHSHHPSHQSPLSVCERSLYCYADCAHPPRLFLLNQRWHIKALSADGLTALRHAHTKSHWEFDRWNWILLFFSTLKVSNPHISTTSRT